MANTTSAKKATRKIARKTEINKSRRTFMRGQLRKMEEAIQTGDKSVAQEQLKQVQPVVMKSASKGIIHKNAAARKISRLSARVKALNAWFISHYPDLWSEIKSRPVKTSHIWARFVPRRAFFSALTNPKYWG